MKKLVYFFLIFSAPLFVTAEEVIVDHPVTGDDVRLVVPDDPDALREAYLNMANLYLGERYDLEEALEVVSEQEKVIKDAEDVIANLRESNDRLSTHLEERERPEVFSLQVVGGYSPFPEETQLHVSIGTQAVLFERLIVGAHYQPLMNPTIVFGFVVNK